MRHRIPIDWHSQARRKAWEARPLSLQRQQGRGLLVRLRRVARAWAILVALWILGAYLFSVAIAHAAE